MWSPFLSSGTAAPGRDFQFAQTHALIIAREQSARAVVEPGKNVLAARAFWRQLVWRFVVLFWQT
jgi:hypothetical protein